MRETVFISDDQCSVNVETQPPMSGWLRPGLPQTYDILLVLTLNGVLCNEKDNELPLQLVSSRALR